MNAAALLPTSQAAPASKSGAAMAAAPGFGAALAAAIGATGAETPAGVQGAGEGAQTLEGSTVALLGGGTPITVPSTLAAPVVSGLLGVEVVGVFVVPGGLAQGSLVEAVAGAVVPDALSLETAAVAAKPAEVAGSDPRLAPGEEPAVPAGSLPLAQDAPKPASPATDQASVPSKAGRPVRTVQKPATLGEKILEALSQGRQASWDIPAQAVTAPAAEPATAVGANVGVGVALSVSADPGVAPAEAGRNEGLAVGASLLGSAQVEIGPNTAPATTAEPEAASAAAGSKEPALAVGAEVSAVKGAAAGQHPIQAPAPEPRAPGAMSATNKAVANTPTSTPAVSTEVLPAVAAQAAALGQAVPQPGASVQANPQPAVPVQAAPAQAASAQAAVAQVATAESANARASASEAAASLLPPELSSAGVTSVRGERVAPRAAATSTSMRAASEGEPQAQTIQAATAPTTGKSDGVPAQDNAPNPASVLAAESQAPDAGEVASAPAGAEAPPAETATASTAPAETPAAPVPVRGAPETVANLAAAIARKLEGRNSRFEVELDPLGLGAVNVSIDIGADGKLSAQFAFDRPETAAEMRGRSQELQRALEQAGFDLAKNSLSFDGGQGRERGGAGGDQPRQNNARAQAFQQALLAAEAADSLPAQPLRLRNRPRAGLDVRI